MGVISWVNYCSLLLMWYNVPKKKRRSEGAGVRRKQETEGIWIFFLCPVITFKFEPQNSHIAVGRSALVHGSLIHGQANRGSIVWKFPVHLHMVFESLECHHNFMVTLVLLIPVWWWFKFLHVYQSSSAAAGRCLAVLMIILTLSWVISSCDCHILNFMAVSVSSSDRILKRKHFYFTSSLLGATVWPSNECLLSLIFWVHSIVLSTALLGSGGKIPAPEGAVTGGEHPPQCQRAQLLRLD